MRKSSSLNVLLNEGALQSRWRQNTGASFIRIRKNKFQFRSQFIYLVLLILIVLIVYISLPTNRQHFTSYKHLQTPSQSKNEILQDPVNYNPAYPLTNPLANAHDKSIKYRIGLIADLDTNSKGKKENEYSSFILRGWVTVSR